jgi:TonB family protein
MQWMIVFALCGYCTTLVGQTYREYHDRQGEKSTPEASYYYEVGRKNNHGFYYDSMKSYFTRTNTLRSIEVRDRFGHRIGDAQTFFENGSLKSEVRYDRKTFRLSGDDSDSLDFIILTFRDSLGHTLVSRGEGMVDGRLDFLRESGKVIHGRRDSVWTTYFNDGRVFCYESWQGGRFVDGVSYDESGKEYYYKEYLTPPIPRGGIDEFYDRLGEEINYPHDAERRGIEGKIIIEVTVEKDGSLTTPHVVQGIGHGCEEEAVKVLTSSPPWQPCRQRGQPARYTLTIPFLFKLS